MTNKKSEENGSSCSVFSKKLLLYMLIILALIVIGSNKFLSGLDYFGAYDTSLKFQYDAGLIVDGESVFSDEYLYIFEGAEVIPSYWIAGFDKSDVTSVRFWLDDVEIEPDQPLKFLEARREKYTLRMLGWSEEHGATFGKSSFFFVVKHKNDEDQRSWFEASNYLGFSKDGTIKKDYPRD